MRVKDVMKKIVVVDDDISVKEAAKIMSEKKLGCLIVVSKDEIKGIVTERDVLKNVDMLSERVGKIMSKDVITISPDDSLDDAAKLMSEHEIKRLPVLKNEDLVGIITATDIIANSNSLNENFYFD